MMVPSEYFGHAERHVRLSLERIEQLDPALRAFITVTADQALQAAKDADAAATCGRWLGLLHGVPVALKDSINLAGVRCTCGSAYYQDDVPPTDATMVKRLRAAGAVIIGKTNLHELCYGGTTQNEHFGSCRNPWDESRVPGGSSGGSAVAVASGMVPLAIGGDTGASVRVPASFNGIAGLRPSAGMVPNSGALPISAPYDTHGPMARSVTMIAHCLAALAGHDPADPHADPRPAPDVLTGLHAGVEGLRVALPKNFFFDDLAPGIGEAVMAAVRQFEELGARIIEITIPGLEHAQDALMNMLYADAAALHQAKLEQAPAKIGTLVRERLQPGLALTATAYAGHRRWLERFEHETRAFFSDRADLVLSSTTPIPPMKVDQLSDIVGETGRMSRFGWPWAAARIPALSVPCGFDAIGMPVGLQLAAGARQEPLLLRAGHAYQMVSEWHLAEPHAAR